MLYFPFLLVNLQGFALWRKKTRRSVITKQLTQKITQQDEILFNSEHP